MSQQQQLITPAILRASGIGFSFLATLPDAPLNAWCIQASRDVQYYMSMGVDFPGLLGGTMSENLPFYIVNRRLYPTVLPVPIQQVTSAAIVFSVNVGGTPVEAAVDPTLFFINNTMGYLEVVEWQAIIVGASSIFMNLAALEPYVAITYTYGWRIPQTRLLANQGDNLNYASLTANWSSTDPVTVTVNGITVLPSAYTVDYLNGIVTFTSPQSATAAITANFICLMRDELQEAARLRVQELMEEYYLQSIGMGGLDSTRSGVRSASRKRPSFPSKGGNDDYQQPVTWRHLVDMLRPPRIGSVRAMVT